MIEFIKNSVEYQQFGWNALTIGFVMTVIFTFFQGYGLFAQNRVIWKEKSGESLSTLFFIYMTFYFTNFMFYGLAEGKIGMVFNALLVIMYVPILIGLWKYKTFSLKETYTSLLCVICLFPSYALMNGLYRESFFLALLIGICLFQCMPIYEMWRAKSGGAVSLNYLIMFMITAVGWLIYAIAIHNLMLEIFNPIAILLFGIMLVMYFKYKKQTSP